MDLVNDLRPEHLAYWRSVDPTADVRTFTAPGDPPNCVPCRAVVTAMVEEGEAYGVVRVAWKPNEIELAHLAQGGTIWLSTWGGLPPHMLEVQEPEPRDGNRGGGPMLDGFLG